jgi:O-glycosyl hydrolase
MKKIFTLFITCFSVVYVNAQVTNSLDLDFTDPTQADRFNFIFDSGGEVTKSVTNGELKIVLNKKEWHFFQVWVSPFDFINNPYIHFKIKADQPTPLRIWVKQADGPELTLYDNTIAAGTQYQTIAFSLENLGPLNNNIQEVGIDIGGYQAPPNIFSGTVYIDEFKLGQAAQPANSLNLDFSEAAQADRLNFIFDTGGELVKSVTNGELKLVLNKKEWHFFQVWINPFEFIKNPYLRFTIRADQNTPVRIWLNQAGGIAEKEIFNQVIPAGTSYQTIQVKVDNVAPLSGYLQELNIDIGGYQPPPNVFSGTVYFDELLLGEAARPATEVYGTSYHEDFSGPLFAGWTSGEGYELSKDGDALKFDVNRSTPVSDAQIGKLPYIHFEGKVLNVQNNPYINLQIRGTDPFTLSVIPIDNSNQKKEHTIRIVPTGNYQTISFDLSSIPGIDLSKIERVAFDFNRQGFAFESDIWINEIRIGEAAANLAVMDAIGDKKYYKNSGTKQVLLTNIKNAAAVIAEGNALIENVSVSPIENGSSTLQFTLKANATGTEPIVLQLQGNSGYAENSYSFNLSIEDNLPPTLDAIASLQAKTKDLIKIPLTGISDGNIAVEQPLSFTVRSANKNIVTGEVIYEGEGADAVLYLLTKKKGNTVVDVILKDNGQGTDFTRQSFNIEIYESLNGAPAIDPVNNIEVYQDAGASTLALTGINDGDRVRQSIAVTATNSNPAVVSNVFIDYSPGSNATLHYTPVADTTGTSTITIKVKDDGGTASNEGDDSTVISFDITVLKRPVTGYVATLQKSIEGFNGNEKYEITEVDSGSFKALVFKCTDKFYWDGVIMNLPQELDLSQHPYLTMEVYPIGQNTLHWLWFYDVTGQRNELNNYSYGQSAIAGQWNKLVFNFSGPNDWINNSTNVGINNKRISYILFDMHNAPFVFPPPPNYTGTFIVRNIRIGSAADFAPTPMVTIKPLPNQVNFVNKTSQKITLSGISNGNGSTAGVSVQINNSNPAVVSNIVVSNVDASGNALLTYNTLAMPGKSTVTLAVSANGSLGKSISFDISVLSGAVADAATVTLTTSEQFQKIHGFGTFSIDAANLSAYTDSMGGTAMRVGLIGNQFEPVNDNDDPHVLNMEGFNYNAFDWNLLKNLKAKGVETFILTSWSPPAWMKTNLSLDHFTAGYTLNTHGTTNRLDFTMYEEFAESMVAVVKAFQQRAGIDLLAIGLQNEPAFHEPYPSAILGPNEFVQLIKVVGRRFRQEGIATKLYMPEHVSQFVADINQYLSAVKADAEADEYLDILAIHGYGSDGITPGQPDFDEWEAYRDSSTAGDHPKEVWMSETHKDYDSFDDALSIAGAIYGALNYGNVSLWTQWAFEGPFVQQGSPTGMLYAMGNFAKFIRPGDVRIDAQSGHDDILATSFVDRKTGRTTVVLINKGNEPLSVKVDGRGVIPLWLMFNTAENRNLERVTSYKNNIFLLPAKSVTTLVGISILNDYDPLFTRPVPTKANEENDRFQVYPNPAMNVLNIDGNNLDKVEIIDISGKIVHQTSLRPGKNTIALNRLSTGVYVTRIFSTKGVISKKIVIAR